MLINLRLQYQLSGSNNERPAFIKLAPTLLMIISHVTNTLRITLHTVYGGSNEDIFKNGFETEAFFESKQCLAIR